MTTPTLADLKRQHRYHRAFAQELMREIGRRLDGKPPRTMTELAEAVQARLPRTVGDRERRLLYAAAETETGR